MLKLIQNNPYRFLGVCSNSPAKERLANSKKANAFLKVNKEVSFPLDLPNVLQPLHRTQDGLTTANNSVNLPKDQLKHALFWFISGSPIDKMALEHLQAGNEAKALELFEKRETFSSLMNRGVLSFINEDLGSGIRCITSVIHNDAYRNAFVEAVCGETFKTTEIELSELFIDSLLEENSAKELKRLFERCGKSSDDENYIKSKSVDDIISSISSAIAKVKNVDTKDGEAQYRAGRELLDSTKDDLITVCSILGATDPQYQIVADALAKQILQCGINYYNNADEDDDETEIKKALALQSYAQSIAVGKLTKDRCDENVKILNEKQKNLPPREVKYYCDMIAAEVSSFKNKKESVDNSIWLIKSATPYLMSIKEVLGAYDEFYLKMSTLVVSCALSDVISHFNVIAYAFKAASLSGTRDLSTVKIFFDTLWDAMLYMDELDMVSDFREERYNKNREILKRQICNIVNINSSVYLDKRGERAIFMDCKSVYDLKKYLRLFPKGKFVDEVNGKFEEFEFQECSTVSDCDEFARKYPYSKFDIRGKREECCYNNCKSASDYRAFLRSYPAGKYSSAARAVVDEEDMWVSCKSSNHKADYERYLAKYPNGRHKQEAQKAAKSCYIATMVYGDYDHPQVVALRQFRDNTLYHSQLGRAFIAFYYKNSPAWVEKMQGHTTINRIIRKVLDTLVNFINNENK